MSCSCFANKRALLLAAACVLSLGCGGSGLPLVKVSGTVTYNGGAPPIDGQIAFTPTPGSVPEGLPRRPGKSFFDLSGSFAAQSYEKGDGLLPGEYKVRIVFLKDASTSRSVPTSWTSPEPLVVEEGQGPISVAYDVPSK